MFVRVQPLRLPARSRALPSTKLNHRTPARIMQLPGAPDTALVPPQLAYSPWCLSRASQVRSFRRSPREQHDPPIHARDSVSVVRERAGYQEETIVAVLLRLGAH